MAYDNDNREVALKGISKQAEKEFFSSLSGNTAYVEQTSFVNALKSVSGFLLYQNSAYEQVTPAVESFNINTPATATASHLKDMTFPGTPQINFTQYEQVSSTLRTPQAKNLFDAVRIAWHRNKHK